MQPDAAQPPAERNEGKQPEQWCRPFNTSLCLGGVLEASCVLGGTAWSTAAAAMRPPLFQLRLWERVGPPRSLCFQVTRRGSYSEEWQCSRCRGAATRGGEPHAPLQKYEACQRKGVLSARVACRLRTQEQRCAAGWPLAAGGWCVEGASLAPAHAEGGYGAWPRQGVIKPSRPECS